MTQILDTALLALSGPVKTLFEQPAGQRCLWASDYALQVALQQPDAVLAEFADDGFLGILSRDVLAQKIKQALQAQLKQSSIDEANNLTESQWMRDIRQLRARLMLRWIWQDANDWTDVITLTRQLSDFADECVIAAQQFSRIALIEKYGEPVNEAGIVQDLIVIAMGKHGAQELNLSSDIDLIFCFDENGETRPVQAEVLSPTIKQTLPKKIKNISVQQFMVYWGQAVIRLLDQVTADGFVFRVDMRLRPWGDGSALALSHAALERYLEQHGRDWERYAWIKARMVTGGAAGDELLAMTRPFVYRRYVDYSAFSALRDMKAMIEREVARRQVEAHDIKLGAGGIREIEFIVQAFQLIYGGARQELRGRQCLVMLQELVHLQLLTQFQADSLQAAYLFLRRLEHALQAMNDQQTQQLPAHPNTQQRIARVLGFAQWEDLLTVLNGHRSRVTEEFEHLIITRHEAEPAPMLDHLEEQLQDILDLEAEQQVNRFWHSKTLQKLPEEARQRLKQAWPFLVQAIIRLAQTSNRHTAQTALLRLLPLLENIVRRSVYLVMLLENRGALQRLVQMFAVSPWIGEELVRYPVLLDELLSAPLDETSSRAELKDQLRQQLLRIERDNTEAQMQVLRLFKKSAVLAVAASDVLTERHLMKVSDDLTDIAEVVLEATLGVAVNAIAMRYGWPQNQNGQRATAETLDFGIIGYGKLGGMELGYGSDLDLVFIHDIAEQEDTDGAKPISGMEFTVRLAQRIMSLLTTQTLDGRAYDIDLRLRPSGDSGLLVSSTNAFRQYQAKNAWLWEQQALVRARGICGGQNVLALFTRLRLDVLTLPREQSRVQHEVIQMRHKMRHHLGSGLRAQQAGVFHLKQDPGGIIDIEFIAQYGVLVWSSQQPALAHYSDNIRILADLARFGFLSETDAQILTWAYLQERTESHRRALAQQDLNVQAADWRHIRLQVFEIWQRLIEPAATASF